MKRAVFDAKTSVLMRRDRRALREMLRHERLPREQAQLVSDRRSARIALHAYRNAPFYRRHFGDAGFTEADVAHPENFALLPALSKAAIQDAGDALISSESAPRDRLVSRTGGSTGRPLQVFNDQRAPVAALWWRLYSWWGVHPSDHVAFIYRQSRAGAKKLRYDMEWWPTRHLLLDARSTTAESMAEFERQVTRFRPRLLVGYVEGVVGYARHIQANGGSPSGLAAISVTASMLHPGQRQAVEAALGAPVFDTYRSAEVPWIAAECGSHAGLHVLSDHRRVDIVDERGAPAEGGVVGDVLVTDFDNRAFPLIRYAIGDRSRTLPGDCACGRSLVRIDHIQGRLADVLRTPSGRSITGGLSGLFTAWPGVVRQFQIHQADDYSVTIRYIPGPARHAATEAAATARKTLADLLGGEVTVRARPVEAVQSDGGKARIVISDVRAAAG